MRRAVIATAGTVAGLVVLLGYKSSGSVKLEQVGITPVTVNPGTTTPATTTPATTTPATTTPATTAPAATGPATTAPATTAPATSAARSYTGPDVQYRYGDVQVEVTVQDGKVTKIAIPQEGATDPHSAMINSYAIPVLVKEALAAQGLNFDVVSGATFTSDAFAQAYQSALSKAGK